MRQVSPAALQAMLAQQTAEIFLACLKVEHPSFSPIRIVYDTKALTRADGIYQPFPFQINLPDQVEDKTSTVKVTFDNVDRGIGRAIRSINGKPSVTMDVVLASQPDTAEAGPFLYSLQDASADASSIECTLGYEDDVFDQSVPATQYTPINSRGLFT